MATKLSRRRIAVYVAQQLLSGAARAPLFNQLAAYLIETKRLSEFQSIMRDIQFQLAEKGYVTGAITSTYPLPNPVKTSIESYAKHQTRAAKIVLEYNTNAALLGGLRLNLPGQEFNATISRQLKTLKTQATKV